MLYKEIAVGFLLAGFAAQIPRATLRDAFLTSSPHAVQVLWGALIGPVDRGRQLRLLGRQRAARGRPVERRDQLRRRSSPSSLPTS